MFGSKNNPRTSDFCNMPGTIIRDSCVLTHRVIPITRWVDTISIVPNLWMSTERLSNSTQATQLSTGRPGIWAQALKLGKLPAYNLDSWIHRSSGVWNFQVPLVTMLPYLPWSSKIGFLEGSSPSGLWQVAFLPWLHILICRQTLVPHT